MLLNTGVNEYPVDWHKMLL